MMSEPVAQEGRSARMLTFETPLSYERGLLLQEAIHRARVEGGIPDTVLFLEHKPVVTLGNRGRDNYLLVSPEELQRRGIDFHRASRGGDVTFHGPGQLVMYPILKLGGREADSHGYLYNLEEVAIRTAGSFGVKAWRREGKNGAWTDAGKIAAIGFRLKRWVSLHGMSFNVTVDLTGFGTMVPCGLEGEPVASLQTILGASVPSMSEVRSVMEMHFSAVFSRPMEESRLSGDESPENVIALLQAVC